MNLNSDFLDNELFQGNLDIAIIISNNTYHYIFDDKENYVIDITPFYDLYLKKGVINEEQYKYAIRNYRGGAVTLNKDNLFNYFRSLSIPPRTCSDMRDFFVSKLSMSKISEVYNNPSLYSNEINMLTCRIPKFLINLDDKKFFHSYIERDFENELPDDWYGESSCDFLSQIPLDKSYWKFDGMDFSKFL